MLRLASGIAAVIGTLFLSRRFEQIDLLRFAICWWGVLLALDGAVRMRHGASPLPRARDFLACAAASVLFWDSFELLDLRLHDWWYVGVPRTRLGGAAFSALCFATVLPAVRLGLALIAPRPDAGTGVASPSRLAARVLFALFAASFILLMAFPTVAFPLAWLLLWFLFEAELARRGDQEPRLESPLQAFRAGDHRVLLRLLALALPLGLLWEGLNFGAARGWVYTVPRFESPKLFEMPLPGYLGYLPFMLECGAALALLDRVSFRLRGIPGWIMLLAIAGFHWQVDGFGRRATTISVAPAMAEARTLPPSDREWLERAGLRTPLDVLRAERAVPARIRDLAEVAQVAHLGIPWAERLAHAGVRGRAVLAAADPARLGERLATLGEDPPHPALVRLWVRAARESR
ncbi:MAG: hypothetical protein ACJ79H_02760 [Myxococcales bacterium]